MKIRESLLSAIIVCAFGLFLAVPVHASSNIFVRFFQDTSSTTSENTVDNNVQIIASNGEVKTYDVGNTHIYVTTDNQNGSSDSNWDDKAKNAISTLLADINEEDAKIQVWIRAWLEEHNFHRKTFWTFMQGKNEVPPADPNGYGIARVKLNMDNNEVCVRMRVYELTDITAAHIHKAPEGQNGSIVVPLPTPDANSITRGCVFADANVLIDLRDHPSDFYVNVHTTKFPNGAIRGQLH